MTFPTGHRVSVTLAVVVGVLFVTAAVNATTSLSTNISTDGSLTVNGSSTFGDAAADVNLFTGTVQASTTAMFTSGVTTYAGSTFGDAGADVNLFTGTLQASTTALFTSGLTTYDNITLGTSGTTTILLPTPGALDEVLRIGFSDTESYGGGYGLVWKYDVGNDSVGLGIGKIPDAANYALDVSGGVQGGNFTGAGFTTSSGNIEATAGDITAGGTLTTTGVFSASTVAGALAGPWVRIGGSSGVVSAGYIFGVSDGAGLLNFGVIPANSCVDRTLSVTGAAVGISGSYRPVVSVSPISTTAAAASSTVFFTGWVSAAETVTVRACQIAAQATSPLSGYFTAIVTTVRGEVAE